MSEHLPTVYLFHLFKNGNLYEYSQYMFLAGTFHKANLNLEITQYLTYANASYIQSIDWSREDNMHFVKFINGSRQPLLGKQDDKMGGLSDENAKTEVPCHVWHEKDPSLLTAH